MGRDSRFPHMCRAPLRFPHQSFMPLEPYPARYARPLPHAGKALSVVILFPHMRVFALTLWGKRYSRIVTFPIGEGGPCQRRSGTFVYRLLETISTALFHPAFPIQPPPLRGTSFHRKEGVSTLAPSLGRAAERSEAGLASFFCGEAASSLLSLLGKGDCASGARVLSLTAHLRRIFHLFHLSFIPPVPYPPLRGTFPSRGRLFILAAKPPLSFLIPHSGRAFIPDQGAAHPTG